MVNSLFKIFSSVNKNITIITIFFVTMLMSCKVEMHENKVTQVLNKWQYSKGDNYWHDAYIPEDIITSLKRDSLQVDYFYSGYYKRYLWLDTVPWHYTTNIDIAIDEMNKNYQLIFNEITGIADIYINGKLIARSRSSFCPLKLDVTKYLNKGLNKVDVNFVSLKNARKIAQKKSFFQLPFNGYEQLRLPKFFVDSTYGICGTPLGLTKPVEFIVWDKFIVNETNFKVLEINDKENAKIRVTYNISSDNNYRVSFTLKNKNRYLINKKYNLKPGTNDYTFDFEIKKPKLWWTYDLGEPYLYNLVSAFSIKKKKIAEFQNNIGIRQIKIDTTGHQFNFYLNDHPLKLKILDYLPFNLFKNRVLADDYKKAVNDFVDAGINMVHVSQDGWYENDEFYNQCDQAGVLVWQDFMIPYKLFDTADNYPENLKLETENVIKLLTNHCSIAFWSGQNFSDDYLTFVKNVDAKKISKAKGFNKQLFESILPELVNTLDSGRSYFEKMDFVSIANIETKFSSFPNIGTFRNMSDQNIRKMNNNIMTAYFRPLGFDTILTKYVKQISPQTEDITSYIYCSYVLSYKEANSIFLNAVSAEGLNGYIVGLYRDYSPVFSNSAVDFGGFWKAKMFSIKKWFKNNYFDIQEQYGWISIFVGSNIYENTKLDFYFKLCNTNGKIFWRRNYYDTEIKANDFQNYFKFNIGSELGLIGRNNAVFKVEVYNKNEMVGEYYYYFVQDEKLNLEKPNVVMKFYKVSDGYAIELSTDKLAKYVYLFTSKIGTFSNNYVDILPGETKKIYFKTNEEFENEANYFRVLNYKSIGNYSLFNF